MLISLNELKLFLEIETSDTGFDTLLTQCIVEAQNLIESYLNYSVESASKTIYITGNNSAVYCFGFVPVTAIASISRRTTPLEAWETVSSSKYSIYELNGLYNVYYEDVFDYNLYKIVYTSGYSSVPDGIKMACLELSASIYLAAKRGTVGIGAKGMTESGSSSTTSYIDLWNNLTKERLCMYRLQTI